MDSITLVFRPLTNEEIPMTTTTPMTIPKTVSPDRSLLARNVATAMLNISP
jgi:hypothetical protein